MSEGLFLESCEKCQIFKKVLRFFKYPVYIIISCQNSVIAYLISEYFRSINNLSKYEFRTLIASFIFNFVGQAV